jgi:hypothetical protein
VRITQIGAELPSGELLVKKNSLQTFDMAFWEDAVATVASDLTGASVAIEVTDGATVTIWTAVISTNRAVWDLTPSDTNVDWEAATFQVVLTKSGDREPVLSGPVRMQS